MVAKVLTFSYILGIILYTAVNIRNFLSTYDIRLLLNAIVAAFSIYIFWRGSKLGEIVLEKMLKHKFYVVKSLFTLSFLFMGITFSFLGILFFLFIGWFFPAAIFPSLEKYLLLLMFPPLIISLPLVVYPIMALRGVPVFLFSTEKEIGIIEALKQSWRVKDRLVFYGAIQEAFSSLLENLEEELSKVSEAFSKIASSFVSALLEWTFVIYISEKVCLPKAFAKAYELWKRTPPESFYGENIALLVFFLLFFLSVVIFLLIGYFANPFSLCPHRGSALIVTTACYKIVETTMGITLLFFMMFVPLTGLILFKPAFFTTMFRLIKEGKIRPGKPIIPAKVEEIIKPYFKKLAEIEERGEISLLSILAKLLNSKIYRIILFSSILLSLFSLLIGFIFFS